MPELRPKMWFVVPVVVVTVAMAIFLYLAWPPAANRRAVRPLSGVEGERLLVDVNVALGRLENQEVAASIPVFEQVSARLPAEPLGHRNLAVARVVALGEAFERVTDERLQQARVALEQLRQVEGESIAWRWLSARVAAAAKDYPRAEAHLAAIVDTQPRNASAWFERFLVRRDATDPNLRQNAFEAIDRAVAIEPQNLFLVVEYLRQLEERLSAELQTINKLPEDEREAARLRTLAAQGDLGQRWKQLRETIAPLADRLQALTGADVLKLMDEAASGIEAANLEVVSDRAGQVSRLILGMASADLYRIRRHPLEFVLDRFSPAVYEQLGADEAAPPQIAVSFSKREFALPEEVQRALKGLVALAVADFDLDGQQDVTVVTGTTVLILGRADDGEQWRPLASANVPAGAVGFVVQDFDLDFDETPAADPATGAAKRAPSANNRAASHGCRAADVDVVVYGKDGVTLLENRRDAATGRRTLEARAQQWDSLTRVRHVEAADLEGDGDLDLVVAADAGLSLWSNRGDGSFGNITSRSALPPEDFGATAMVAVDWDRDADVDLIVGGKGGVGWLENLRHGQIRWRTLGEGFPTANSVVALEVLDADGNGSWDLVVSDRSGMIVVRTRSPRPGVVQPLEDTESLGGGAASIKSWDYDNDGVLDLVAVRQGELVAYRGIVDGRFEPVEALKPLSGTVERCAMADIDADGDRDLVIGVNKQISIGVNEGGNRNHWLDVGLVARQMKGGEASASGRVNAHGVGSLLEVKTGARYQQAIVRGPVTHFGLGANSSADVVRVVWLNGVPQNIVQPRSDQIVCELQRLTGSCPYLYAWNGKRFEFVTDLLWGAPLGLQAADGVLMPSREWEYLKIDGEQLAAKDGEYVLQITEELWEAAYFDQLKLIAVDHPADVAVYSNEKVGPAEFAKFKIHTVQKPRSPVAATNHRGRDLLPELDERDGVYCKAFDTKLRQGLVEEHFLELDLGDLRNAKRVTLFLTGWIYPSGTSVNVGVSQNAKLVQPKPPALFVGDGNGGWKEALPFMGFPGGKTKTIVVDLSGLFVADDYRVRIATTMEFYWDQLFFTVDEPASELRLTELELTGADLHERGFSRIVHSPHHGPEQFIYHEVSREPKWPPMLGRFTRFGDVTELVQASDDRLAVMGAGDEMTVTFAAPQKPLPPGCKRDFLLYSVGWDKDANLCTVAGETVEPLPFRTMKSYPPQPSERGPIGTEYDEYLRKYQTRQQMDQFWQAVRRF